MMVTVVRSNIEKLKRSVADDDSALGKTLKRVLLPLLIIFVGVAIHKLLVWMRYVPPKIAVSKTAALVSTIQLQRTTERAVLVGYGTVEPSQTLEVRAQVTGHITGLGEEFEVGSRVRSGETIVSIDPRDYQIAIEAQKANVARAEFELELEEGNQVVARREWELLSDDLKSGEIGERLALRKPHLREKQAALDAARSRLKKAELDLERTRIVSPFDGVVLEENVEIGKYVNSQTMLATLAATDEFFVKAKVPRKNLRWLDMESSGDLQASSVRLSDGQEDHSNTAMWSAQVVRLLSDVDAAGRMARILISVTNPLDPPADGAPLLIGSFVRVEIEGRELRDVYRVPRTAVREGDVLWIVNEEGTLQFAPIEVVQSRNNVAVVRGDLREGQSVITSPLQGVLQGMEVRATDQGDGEARE